MYVQEDVDKLFAWGLSVGLKTKDIRVLETLYMLPALVSPMQQIENGRKPCPLGEGHVQMSSIDPSKIRDVLFLAREGAVKDFVEGKDKAVEAIIGMIYKKA